MFMSDCDLCMLNGRFGANKFTVRSTSVVDYTLVPIGHFSKFSKFHVEYVTDLIMELDILVDKSLSDHSVLCWSYYFKVCTVANNIIGPQLTVHPSTRLSRVKIPEKYLTDPIKSCSINKLTSSINKLQQPSHLQLVTYTTNFALLYYKKSLLNQNN